jgi:hypothetical protein
MSELLFLANDHEEHTGRPNEGPARVRSPQDASELLRRSNRCVWIANNTSDLRLLTPGLAHLRPRSDHRIVIYEKLPMPRGLVLRAVFKSVIDRSFGIRMLPFEQIVEVLRTERPNDYIIGGAIDLEDRVLLLYRGLLDALVVPLSWFTARRGIKPDPNRFEVIDFGTAIRLGEYEASTDAILYEFDRDYRRRARENLVKKDQTFGGALRRLRLQKGLKRSDFPGVDSKTIARIERNEVERPHAETLEVIARVLGVPAEDIETY